MITMQEVAQKAGVSVATVSRVMNRPSQVSEITRTRVEKIIKEFGYEPSVLGRNLRTSKSQLILTLIPSISNPFYTNIINGIEDKVIENGYNILLCETNADPKRQSLYFKLIKNRLADGIISMDPTINKKELVKLSSQYPVVQCSEYDEDETLSYVTINHKAAAYHAVEYLVKLGHEKIGLINSNKMYLYSRHRLEGYKHAMNDYGKDIDESWIYNAHTPSFQEGQKAMKYLLNQNKDLTAFFSVSDMLAIGALNEVNNRGMKIPQDIALMGFDNIDFSKMTNPSLTTVHQPAYQMGITSAKMLLDKIKGNDVESIVFNHELVVRKSTE